MDPYLIVELGSQSFTTRAKDNEGKKCKWAERIEMEVT
jgi:predicted secreted protein